MRIREYELYGSKQTPFAIDLDSVIAAKPADEDPDAERRQKHSTWVYLPDGPGIRLSVPYKRFLRHWEGTE